ncbi:MAG TPA: hypothetical protein VIJ93_09385 [bacterium]
MILQKINVKIFLEKGADLPLKDFIPIFHRWIQQNKLEGLLIDVTEYTHVQDGPGVLLIAQEANYGLDESDGKRGFLYSQKRAGGKSDEDHLKTAFKRILQACAFFEGEAEIHGKLKFDPNHFQVLINDRLAAPNNTQSHEMLEGILKPFLDKLYSGAKYILLHEKNLQKRTGFEVKVDSSASFSYLLTRLGPN